MSTRITLMMSDANIKAIRIEQAKQIKAQGTKQGNISFSKVANKFLKCGVEAPKHWRKK